MRKRTKSFKIIMGILTVLFLAFAVSSCIYLFSYHKVKKEDFFYLKEGNEGTEYGVKIKFTKDGARHSNEIGTIHCGNDRRVELKVKAEVSGGTLYMVIGSPDMITGSGEWQIGSEDAVYIRREYTKDTTEIIDLSDYTSELKIAFYVDDAAYEQFVLYQEQDWMKGYLIFGNELYDRFGINWLADEETKKRPPICNPEEYVKYMGQVLEEYAKRQSGQK